MEKWQLLHEQSNLVESLTEKTKFLYSEKFYSLSLQERQKYANEKFAEEAHLKALSALLWDNDSTPSTSLVDMFSLGLIGSMFNSSSLSSYGLDENKKEQPSA